MRVVIIFACLCFLLLRGDQYVFTAAHHDHICFSPAMEATNAPQIKTTDTNQDDTITPDSDVDDVEDYLVSDDVEDDDASNFLVRKLRLLVRCYFAVSCPSSFSYLSKCYKAPPSGWGQLPNIYLTQSVLRI
jgi:hypothetical protein